MQKGILSRCFWVFPPCSSVSRYAIRLPSDYLKYGLPYCGHIPSVPRTPFLPPSSRPDIPGP